MFKEYVANDLKSVFINPDEHGELAKINGVNVEIIEDNDRLGYRTQKDFDGLISGDILFFITYEEYKKIPQVSTLPKARNTFTYKGKPVTVTSVFSDVGIYEIICQFSGAR